VRRIAVASQARSRGLVVGAWVARVMDTMDTMDGMDEIDGIDGIDAGRPLFGVQPSA